MADEDTSTSVQQEQFSTQVQQVAQQVATKLDASLMQVENKMVRIQQSMQTKTNQLNKQIASVKNAVQGSVDGVLGNVQLVQTCLQRHDKMEGQLQHVQERVKKLVTKYVADKTAWEATQKSSKAQHDSDLQQLLDKLQQVQTQSANWQANLELVSQENELLKSQSGKAFEEQVTRTKEAETKLLEQLTKNTELNSEFELHKQKVDEWKAKVKLLQDKSAAQVQQLKKKVKEQEDVLAKQSTKLKHDKYVVQLRTQVDEQLWCYVTYPETESPAEWLLQEHVKKDNTEPVELPETEQEKHAKELAEVQKQLDVLKQSNNEKEEELKKYKTRAHNALKKSKENIEKMKEEANAEANKLKIEVQSLNEQLARQNESNKDLDAQVQSLLEVQQKVVQLGSELSETRSANDMLAEKVKFLENSLTKLNQEKEEAQTKAQADFEALDQAKQSMEQQLRKEVQTSRDRMRKMVDEKERDIAILQKRVSELQSELASQKKQYETDIKEMDLQMKQQQEQFDIQLAQQLPSEPATPVKQESQPTNPEPKKTETDILREILPTQDKMEDVPLNEPLPPKEGYDSLMQLIQKQAQTESILAKYKAKVSKWKDRAKEHEISEKQAKETLSRVQKELQSVQAQQTTKPPNMEYLRNIMIKFLDSNDPKIRKKLFVVIATILSMSAEEQAKIVQKIENDVPKKSGIFSFV